METDIAVPSAVSKTKDAVRKTVFMFKAVFPQSARFPEGLF